MNVAPSRRKPRKLVAIHGTSRRRVISLDPQVERCRHGHQLEEAATEEVADGWMVWGRYPCSQCGRIGLDFRPEPPDVILLGGRRLVPTKLHAS